MSVIFGLNNRIDVATLTSSATFVSTLSLANLKTPILAQTARTTTADPLTLTINLASQPDRNIGCVCLANHNLSRDAVVTISVYRNSSTLLESSGAMSPWPYLSADDQHWSVRTFTMGIVDTVRIADLTPTVVWFSAGNWMANRVVIEIDDSTNPDGFIELGRVFVGEQLQPKRGEEWGDVNYGLIDYSQIQTTLRRVRYAYRYPVIRTVSVPLKHLSKAEGLGGLFAAQRAAGLVGEVVVAPELPVMQVVGDVSAVDSNWFALAMMGNFTSLDRLTNPYLGAYGTTIDVEEVAR